MHANVNADTCRQMHTKHLPLLALRSARKQELQDMAGEEVFGTFYEKLKDIRDYYRKFPDDPPAVPDFEIKRELS